MRAVRTLAVLLTLGSLAACYRQVEGDIPLVWAPSENASLAPAMNLPEIGHARLEVAELRDVRQNPRLIGSNIEEATPRSVITSDDVGVFVTRHLRELLGTGGVTVVDADGDVVLSGEVRQFFVEEKNIYKSAIELSLVARARGGTELWHGTVTGSRRTFGHSYTAPNYYKVLSTAMVDAAGQLLRDPGQALAER